MEAPDALSSISETGSADRVPDCPRCAEPSDPVVSLCSTVLPGVPLKRCRRCGGRHTADAGRTRLLEDCAGCGLPFLYAADAPPAGTLCATCAQATEPAELPHPSLVAATEREVQLALEPRWRFIASESASRYLDKVLRQVAGKIGDAPAECRVALFEDQDLRTLTLPSGVIMISQGALDELEDEAQLAFVLGHELAHASSGDGATRLVRLGFHAVTHEAQFCDEKAWADGAEDLVRLGFGTAREREADQRALQAVLDLGYDAGAVLRYLRRIDALVESGDPRVAELALAHPPAGERLRRVSEVLDRRVDDGAGRQVNREVFRRVAERHAGSVERAPLRDIVETAQDLRRATRTDRLRHLLPWMGVAAALLLVLFWILAFVL